MDRGRSQQQTAPVLSKPVLEAVLLKGQREKRASAREREAQKANTTKAQWYSIAMRVKFVPFEVVTKSPTNRTPSNQSGPGPSVHLDEFAFESVVHLS